MATVPARPLSVTLTSTDVPDHDAWLAALRPAIEDALAAGEDATRRLSERVLSRGGAAQDSGGGDEDRNVVRDAGKRCYRSPQGLTQTTSFEASRHHSMICRTSPGVTTASLHAGVPR